MDFLSVCSPGVTMKTRDRRDARITAVAPAEGLISGEVEMHGPCAWLSDGRWRDAPFGAAGPLDLVPPLSREHPSAAQPVASVKEALAEDNRIFCCD